MNIHLQEARVCVRTRLFFFGMAVYLKALAESNKLREHATVGSLTDILKELHVRASQPRAEAEAEISGISPGTDPRKYELNHYLFFHLM